MPLSDLNVVEFAGLGPVPFAGMVLAGLGANILRVDRPGGPASPDPMIGAVGRGKRSIALDLKQPAAIEVALQLVGWSDVLLEGFRPGVMERLGLGPDVCLTTNPDLIYGRMTGWGSDGPYSTMAGHDINYIALTGALHAIGDADRMAPPLNLVGDGGGAMFLVAGVLAALHDRPRSGGTVVHSAIVDGAASLMSPIYELSAIGLWEDRRDSNILDGGAPFYTTYTTSDGESMAVGAIEPHFYAKLLAGLGLDAVDLPAQNDRSGWPELLQTIGDRFATRTRAEWTMVFEDTDACVTPVLALSEAPDHPHNTQRAVFGGRGGRRLPNPTPRIENEPTTPLTESVEPGADTAAVLVELGLGLDEIASLMDSGAVA
jgi:alpha-methylacyl-CoA racemase